MATAQPTEVPEARRRLSLRRGRGGGGGSSFGGGGTGRMESYQGSDVVDEHGDEVDDAIDPNNPRAMDEQVRARMALPAPVTADEARDNPRSRLNEVSMAGSASYAKEYRLQLLHRLLMRSVPLDQIARQLQVSISTIEKDRAELKRRLREAAKELNIDEMVGNQNAVYDEIQAMALKVASAGVNADGTGGVPTAMKLAAMRTALAANADRTRFLNTAGVFDVLKFRRSDDGSDLSDIQLLMQRTAEVLANLDMQDAGDVPAPSRVVRRRKKGGFDKMTFDDADASGSSNEVQEL